jgi:hypothetical protein
MPYRFNHWREKIQDARNESSLAIVIRDYRSTLSPAIVDSLPSECRDSLDNNDIPGAALTLLQCEVTHKGSPEVAAFLHEVAQTYAAAAVKIAAWRGGG